MITVKVVAAIYRLQNTVNGNPRFRVEFEDGEVATTYPDAMSAYAIDEHSIVGKTVHVTRRKGCVEMEVQP